MTLIIPAATHFRHSFQVQQVLQKCLDVRHQNLSFRCEALGEGLDGPRRPRKLLPDGARPDILVIGISEFTDAFRHPFEDREYSKHCFYLDSSTIGRVRLGVEVDNDYCWYGTVCKRIFVLECFMQIQKENIFRRISEDGTCSICDRMTSPHKIPKLTLCL